MYRIALRVFQYLVLCDLWSPILLLNTVFFKIKDGQIIHSPIFSQTAWAVDLLPVCIYLCKHYFFASGKHGIDLFFKVLVNRGKFVSHAIELINIMHSYCTASIDLPLASCPNGVKVTNLMYAFTFILWLQLPNV